MNTTTTNTTTTTDPRPPMSDDAVSEVHSQLLSRMNATLHDMAADGRDPTAEIPPALLLFDSDGSCVTMVNLQEFVRDDIDVPIQWRKDLLADVIRRLRAAGAPLIAYVTEAWVRQVPKEAAERDPPLIDGASMADDPRYRIDGVSFNYIRPDMPPRLITHKVGVVDGVRVIGDALWDTATRKGDLSGRFAIGSEDRSNLQ